MSWYPQCSACPIGPPGSLPGFISLSAPTSKGDDKGHSLRRIFQQQLLAFSSHSFLQLGGKKKSRAFFPKIFAFLLAADRATCTSFCSLPFWTEGGKRQALCFLPLDSSSLCLWKDTPSHFKQVGGKGDLEISYLFS